MSVRLWVTHCSFRRNVIAVASRWQHCLRFERPEIWTWLDLPLQRRMGYCSTTWPVDSRMHYRWTNRLAGRAVTRLALEREVWGSNLRPVKSETVLPTARHRGDIFSKRIEKKFFFEKNLQVLWGCVCVYVCVCVCVYVCMCVCVCVCECCQVTVCMNACCI